MVSGQTGVTWGTSDKGTKILYCNGTDVVDTNIGGGVKDTMHAAGSAITVSLNDLVDITAIADTDSCDVEVFVGSA